LSVRTRKLVPFLPEQVELQSHRIAGIIVSIDAKRMVVKMGCGNEAMQQCSNAAMQATADASAYVSAFCSRSAEGKSPMRRGARLFLA
jgi:hypothetical protein